MVMSALDRKVEGARESVLSSSLSPLILYELVTGKRPFGGQSAVGLFIAIAQDEPVPPSALNPRVVPALEAIVRRCLRKSPGERFASCREVAEALRRVSGQA
jgi:serine/threonine-protein kinase